MSYLRKIKNLLLLSRTYKPFIGPYYYENNVNGTLMVFEIRAFMNAYRC